MPAYFGAEQMKKPNQMVALQFNEVVKAHASLIKQNDTYIAQNNCTSYCDELLPINDL